MLGSLITLSIAALLLAVGGWMFRAARARRRWPTVRGSVTGHRIESETRGVGDDESVTFTPIVRYRYEVNAQAYTSEGPGLSRTGYGSSRRAEKVAARYPTGAAIDVHYNPAKPAEAFLESGSPMTWIILGMGIVTLAAAVLLALAGL